MSEQPAQPAPDGSYYVPQQGEAHTQDPTAYTPPAPEPTPADGPQHVTADQPGDVHPASIAGDAEPEPEPEPEPVHADEPVIITPVERQPEEVTQEDTAAATEQLTVASTAPVTMAEATAGEENISSLTVHPGILVRLSDVYAHIENFFARHPELERFLGAELKSAIGTAERVNSGGGYAPVGNVPPTAPEPEPAAEEPPAEDDPRPVPAT